MKVQPASHPEDIIWPNGLLPEPIMGTTTACLICFHALLSLLQTLWRVGSYSGSEKHVKSHTFLEAVWQPWNILVCYCTLVFADCTSGAASYNHPAMWESSIWSMHAPTNRNCLCIVWHGILIQFGLVSMIVEDPDPFRSSLHLMICYIAHDISVWSGD